MLIDFKSYHLRLSERTGYKSYHVLLRDFKSNHPRLSSWLFRLQKLSSFIERFQKLLSKIIILNVQVKEDIILYWVFESYRPKLLFYTKPLKSCMFLWIKFTKAIIQDYHPECTGYKSYHLFLQYFKNYHPRLLSWIKRSQQLSSFIENFQNLWFKIIILNVQVKKAIIFF